MFSLEIFTTEVVAFFFFPVFLFISAGHNKLIRATVISLLFNQEDKQSHDCGGSKQASADTVQAGFTSFLIKTRLGCRATRASVSRESQGGKAGTGRLNKQN